jgi:hypothetical protein
MTEVSFSIEVGGSSGEGNARSVRFAQDDNLKTKPKKQNPKTKPKNETQKQNPKQDKTKAGPPACA